MDRGPILIITVFAIGLYAAPQAVALFQGGHVWYDTKNMPCQKCHADVFAQLDGSAHHKYIGISYGMTSYEGECRTCHQVGNWDERSHMAVTPLCIYCHPQADDELLESTEAHRPFYMDTVEMGMDNYACLGCHTHVRVDIKYDRPSGFSFYANSSDYRETTGSGSITGWNMDDNFSSFSENDNEVPEKIKTADGKFDPDQIYQTIKNNNQKAECENQVEEVSPDSQYLSGNSVMALLVPKGDLTLERSCQ